MSIGTTSNFPTTSEWLKKGHQERCMQIYKVRKEPLVVSLISACGVPVMEIYDPQYLVYMLTQRESERILTKIKEHDNSNYRR